MRNKKLYKKCKIKFYSIKREIGYQASYKSLLEMDLCIEDNTTLEQTLKKEKVYIFILKATYMVELGKMIN